MRLALSEKATASNLDAFVCFFGWKKMADEEIQQRRTLTQKYGYENIPAVGISLRMYEYGMECLPASYFDLSCRLIRPLKQESFLELCRTAAICLPDDSKRYPFVCHPVYKPLE